MNADIWKLAAAVIGAARTRRELIHLTDILDGTESRAQLLDALYRWAETSNDSAPQRKRPIPSETRRTGSSTLEGDTATLFTLLRDGLRFSNVEIEDWLSSRFDVRTHINKKSLSNYLERLLRERGPSFFDKVYREATQEQSRRGPIRRNVAEFSRRFEERRSGPK